jgi:NDP-sugar pyrophosphorylase family protein
VEPGVYIKGPTIIGENCDIRHGAYIRGNCLIGDNCIVGHTSEMKTALLLNGAKVPHFAYVGDSLLGSKSNLGAGTKISNFKITQDEVNVMGNGINMGSGLRKFGAIIGDNVQTGCNTVLNPGTLIGRDSLIYPLTSLRGVIPPRTVVKLQQKSQNRPMR